MPFSPWPMPSVPDVDLAAFAEEAFADHDDVGVGGPVAQLAGGVDDEAGVRGVGRNGRVG